MELTNRSGKREYWGNGLEELVKNHQKGDPVTLTLQARETFRLSGETRDRIRNIWAITPVSNGITVNNDQPHAGQHTLEFPMATFSQVMLQMQQHWPQIMQEVRSPKNPPNNLYIGEDRQPASAPQDQSMRLPLAGNAPNELIPAIASADKDNRQLNLLLVHSADDHLQGVVRLNGTLYPALATPSADNRQLVINALTDNGLQFAGYGEAVNHDENNHQRPSPQIMQFHLKQQDSPLFAAIHKPEEQPDKLFRSLGFEQTWKEWSDSQKAEDRQEKLCNRHNPTAPADEPVRTTMNMKKTLLVILTGITLASPVAGAATCRAGAAAEAGSRAAWERARTASQAWSQRENDVASSLQSCLSRIKDISITLPQFPSLDKLLRDLENQVCDAVVDRVNDHLPGNIDPGKTTTSEQEHHERSTTHLPVSPEADNSGDIYNPVLRTIAQSEQRAALVPGLVRALLYSGAALCISLVANGIQYWHATGVTREYFATDNGRLVRLAPTSQPAWSQSDVMNFGSMTLSEAFNLDFVHYRKQITTQAPAFPKPALPAM